MCVLIVKYYRTFTKNHKSSKNIGDVVMSYCWEVNVCVTSGVKMTFGSGIKLHVQPSKLWVFYSIKTAKCAEDLLFVNHRLLCVWGFILSGLIPPPRPQNTCRCVYLLPWNQIRKRYLSCKFIVQQCSVNMHNCWKYISPHQVTMSPGHQVTRSRCWIWAARRWYLHIWCCWTPQRWLLFVHIYWFARSWSISGSGLSVVVSYQSDAFEFSESLRLGKISRNGQKSCRMLYRATFKWKIWILTHILPQNQFFFTLNPNCNNVLKDAFLFKYSAEKHTNKSYVDISNRFHTQTAQLK